MKAELYLEDSEGNSHDFSSDINFTDGLYSGTDWIYAHLKQPENERQVIVCVLDGGKLYVTDGHYFVNGNTWFVGGERKNVIYWMDFPEPPGEEIG